MRVKFPDAKIKATLLRNIPQRKQFQSSTEELCLIYEYVRIRMRILKRVLVDLANKYDHN